VIPWIIGLGPSDENAELGWIGMSARRSGCSAENGAAAAACWIAIGLEQAAIGSSGEAGLNQHEIVIPRPPPFRSLHLPVQVDIPVVVTVK